MASSLLLKKPSFQSATYLLRNHVMYYLQALHHEETQGTGIGAAVAETILEVTERILQEASSAQTVMVTVLPRQEVGTWNVSSLYSLGR